MQEPDATVDTTPSNGAPHEPNSPTSPVGGGHRNPSFSAVDPIPVAGGPDAAVADEATKKAVDSVLYSDIGVNTLLNRLKQSIASVKDFAGFLKKRSSTEDDHAKELRRLCRTTHQDIRKADSRQGTYARQFEAITNLHERMADNGLQFALNLHQMHEDLNTLAFEMEKGRKNWKQLGLSAENKAAEAEKQMERAKQKYDTLAEQYDHAKTGEASGRFGLRMKSAEQREEELQGKVETADKDYQSKVQYAKQQRQELLAKTRPQAVKALEDLIAECDAGLALQMQKFATFNERLLLGNGLLVSPLNEANGVQQPSMRDLVSKIDNTQDFQSYIRSFGVKVPTRAGDIEYKQHPTLAPKSQPMRQPEYQPQPVQPTAEPVKDSPPTIAPPVMGASMGAGTMSSNSYGASPPKNPPSAFPMAGYGAQIPDNQHSPISPRPSDGFGSAPPYSQSRDDLYSAPSPQGPSHGPPPHGPAHGSLPHHGGPPPMGNGPSQGFGGPPQYSGQPSPYGRSQGGYPGSPPGPGPMGHGPMGAGAMAAGGPPPPRPSTREGRGSRPVFGLSLDELFRRDTSPVPLVVYQCIQAVDLFGLDHEGIYRVSGNTTQVQDLKQQFNQAADRVDFRNPEAFHHDVNNAANLLKQFFRELPDPLFTNEHHQELLEAAKITDDVARRDNIHAIINALPDPNYATLRALTLHLHRVEEHSEANRMTPTTLAVIFAPTLMGQHMGQMADAAMQPKVIETVLQNALQIFDED